MVVGAGAYQRAAGQDRRRMGRQMAETLEWVIFAYQGVTLAQTAWINPFAPVYRFIVIGLAAGHLLVAVHVLARHRLIVGSPRRTAAWMAIAAAVPVALALMLPHHLYAANDACVTACTYPAPLLLITSLYPWVFGTVLAGMLAGLLLILVLAADWLALLFALGTPLTPTALQSIAVSVTWVSAAYVIGLALRRLIAVWLENTASLHEQDFGAFVSFLHSDIKAGLAAVELQSPDADGMLEKIRELHNVIARKRLDMLMAVDNVELALIVSEKIRLLSVPGTRFEPPSVGQRSVSPATARLLDRALGDLLQNAVVNGAGTVRIGFAADGGKLMLDIIDDGPGFDGSVLDNPGQTLHALRRSARDRGGDLTMRARHPRGSHLAFTIPDEAAIAGGKGVRARAHRRGSQPAGYAHRAGTAQPARVRDGLGSGP